MTGTSPVRMAPISRAILHRQSSTASGRSGGARSLTKENAGLLSSSVGAAVRQSSVAQTNNTSNTDIAGNTGLCRFYCVLP